MRWSSIKDFIWDSLPYYFHNRDTHTSSHHSDGVLKRFLDVCSKYFDDEVKLDIDNFINLWDVDTTSPIFLNYIWEYLGYIPYAYGIITTGKDFNKDELASVSRDYSNYIRKDNCPLPEVDYRRLLKYAISLYKIRCTKQFYTILGRFYGIEIVVKDPTENDDPFEDSLGQSGVSPWEGKYDTTLLYYDSIESVYDKNESCHTCDRLEAIVYIPKSLYDHILYNGGNMDNTKTMILEILNRYIPIQVRPFTMDLPVADQYTVAVYEGIGSVYGSDMVKDVYPSYSSNSNSSIKFIVR